MSTGYIIFTDETVDADAIAAVLTLLAAGGTAIIAGPPADVAEGAWHGDATVVLEFDGVEAAHA